MAPPDPHQRTQEQSIKARKHQLFESDESTESGPRQSFAETLRTTPADPLSPPIKAGLWVLGTLVILLLLAAFAKVGTKKPTPKKRPATALVAPAGISAIRPALVG